MSASTRSLVAQWARLGPRFLPFADAASDDLPLPRLLRLSLFQVSVGMALVLLVGTLNRVMIVELKLPAALVAVMVSLPVLYAPARALVGFRSDNHRCALGWRRVPFIWMGTLLQFGGFAMMPFALLVLAGAGDSAQWPAWLGPAGAGLAFLLVGAGLHTTQTAGLALATDLSPRDRHPQVVGLMYVMLLLGSVGGALVFGLLLRDFSPGRLVQVIQAAAVTTLVLNGLSLWKQEMRRPNRGAPAVAAPQPDFVEALRHYAATPATRLRLGAIALGTLGFGMQDVLLEPFGGRVLGLSVAQTTGLTAALAGGCVVGLAIASGVLSRGAMAARVALAGAACGSLAFVALMLSAALGSVPLFVAAVAMVGLGAGLFGHGTLTMTMNSATPQQAGLALGAWGAVQATAAGLGVLAGGLGHDLASAAASSAGLGVAAGAPAFGYLSVYALETALLIATVGVLWMLAGFGRSPGRLSSD
jgi:BCD family chlorophyll transporter-like MFS transporter